MTEAIARGWDEIKALMHGVARVSADRTVVIKSVEQKGEKRLKPAGLVRDWKQ